MKNPHPSPFYLPKGPCLKEMCPTCPFQPNGRGKGLDHPDFKPGGDIIRSIEMGLPFYCHQTVLFDKKTKMYNGEPDTRGGPQAHWANCRGAVLYKQGKIELPERPSRREDFLGHANLSNLSRAFINRIYAKGKVSIADIAKAVVDKGDGVHASEGLLDNEHDVRNGLIAVVNFYLKPIHAWERDGPTTAVIEPVGPLTAEQERVYAEFFTDKYADWQAGDDGLSGDYGLFESIPWKFQTSWRKRFKQIPLLSYITV